MIDTRASCCGYDSEIFSPEAHARRAFLKAAGLAAGTLGLGSAAAAAPHGAAPRWPDHPARPRDVQLAQAAPAAPVREISNIAGDLWRFRNNFHFSVFLVTPQGIVATDPISADAARWLKAELTQRFPGQPVRYLVYSHDHADHISGGEVFADTAVVVAHDRAREKIRGERRPTAVPNVTFSESLTLELGGAVVRLVHVGRNHSDNSLVALFPAQRTLFAVDFIPVEGLAFRTLNDSYIEEWLESLRRVETMDFDVLAPGHGPLGQKRHVAAFRDYLQTLHDQVLAGIRGGRTVDQLKQELRLDRYASWAGYEQMRDLNIEGMHRYLTVFRVANP
jgi:glyoxylase-like metal-dependent hydrolase (beta-lactamase superfamily II)